MSLRELPRRPNLEHLKNQARTLLDACLGADQSAIARFAAWGVTSPRPRLADALHVIAREYGFETWPALKLHVEVSSEDAMRALSAAIKAREPALVEKVLGSHRGLRVRINEPLPDYSFDTPAIVAAVQQDSQAMVDALIDAGADINQRTRWWAGSFGVLDMAGPQLAAHLISRGASIDIHAAARLGMIDRVGGFLRENPRLVHARGGDGQLPLHFAATVEIAALLLDHGAEIDARDIDHESTAAQYMASSRQMMEWREPYRHDVVRFLISRGAETDILMASAIGDLALVERILGRDPDTIFTTVSDTYFPRRNPHSGGSIYVFGFGPTKSPHLVAHQFGQRAVFDLLIERSPAWLRMNVAAEIGDEDLVDRVVGEDPRWPEKLPPVEARRIVGAALRNNTQAVELLIRNGWPPGAGLENQQTALHYASWHGNLEMVRALLQHGAPVNVLETGHGGSPLAWALHGSMNSWERERGDYPGVVRALLASGADIPKPNRPLEATEEVLEILKQHPG